MNAHIHAENMRLYAEDATKTDKPWELWEFISLGMEDYQTLESNPNWGFDTEYRRVVKEPDQLVAAAPELLESCKSLLTLTQLIANEAYEDIARVEFEIFSEITKSTRRLVLADELAKAKAAIAAAEIGAAAQKDKP